MNLLRPLNLGRGFITPNRVMMSPMYMNVEADCKMESEAHMTQLASFYEERVKNGAKLIVCGGVSPSKLGQWKDSSLSLRNMDSSKALSKIADVVHKHDGVVLAQAFHAGRSAIRRIRLSSSNSLTPAHPFAKWKPIRIPSLLIDAVVAQFERFAKLSEMSGFDGVEVSLSDGSLLHNFLSQAVNDRVDDFGGSFENRLEIVLRVIANIRNSLQNPDRFLVTTRICTHDLQPNGNSMEETLLLAELLAASGNVDLINTSVGMHDSPVQTLASYVPEAAFVTGARMIKQRLKEKGFNVPVAASHRIKSVEMAEKLLAEGTCDVVNMGRALLADAQFIEKVKHNEASKIIPCIGCNHCVNRLYKLQRVTCAINPRCGYETDPSKQPSPAQFRKNIAVVGAGAAGITCALTLSRRGHNVILYEKSSQIGGQLNLAKLVPGKQEYIEILKRWTDELRESTVKVMLNTDFTHYDVTSNHQILNAVVLCCGSFARPISSSKIPGASESAIVVPFEKILDGSVIAGRKVVILGNGAISHDVASYLLHDHKTCLSPQAYCTEWGVNLAEGTLDVHAQRDATKNNRDVILFNKAEKDADLARGKGWFQKKWIRNHRGTIIHNGLWEAIDSKSVTVSTIIPNSQQLEIDADTIVWAMGMLPNVTVGTWIYEWVKDGAMQRGQLADDFGIYMAGSCRDAYTGDGHGEQDLLQAVHEGFEIGCKV
jgi:2,4-dienoyl-CoA reductase (NADPH2)